EDGQRRREERVGLVLLVLDLHVVLEELLRVFFGSDRDAALGRLLIRADDSERVFTILDLNGVDVPRLFRRPNERYEIAERHGLTLRTVGVQELPDPQECD